MKQELVKYVIQCKRYDSSVGVSAIQEVIGSRSVYNCHVGIVATNNYFTKPGVILAEKNNVILWDRDILIQKMVELDLNCIYSISTWLKRFFLMLMGHCCPTT